MKKLTISAALTVVAPAVGLASAAATEPVASTLPGPTGPYPVGPTELHLVDHDRTDPWTSRPRELMVSLWYPAAVNGSRARHLRRPWPHYDRNAGVPPGTADFAGTVTHSRTRATPLPGRRPVVLYSPGGGHSRFLGTTLVEDLASRGYVVVGIDHTPVGPVQFPDRVALPRCGVDAAQVVRECVRDTGFVLDEPAAFPALDLTRVGMVGHSMGGFTTAEATSGDERIDAGVNLGGSMDPRYGQAATLGVTRPFLLVGGGLSAGRAAQPRAQPRLGLVLVGVHRLAARRVPACGRAPELLRRASAAPATRRRLHGVDRHHRPAIDPRRPAEVPRGVLRPAPARPTDRCSTGRPTPTSRSSSDHAAPVQIHGSTPQFTPKFVGRVFEGVSLTRGRGCGRESWSRRRRTGRGWDEGSQR